MVSGPKTMPGVGMARTAIRNLMAAVVFLCAVAILPNSAKATIWAIDGVLSGSSGFGASLFHDASGSNAMSGATLANIPTGRGSFGTFNDVTGEFHAVLPIDTVGPTFMLDSTGADDLDFGGGFDTLQSKSTLQVTLNVPGLNGVTSALLGFNPGFVCCGSTPNDPNSFFSDGAGGAIMTLWGADGYSLVDGSYTNANIGLDLRLHLTPVPIPGAVWLFGSALLGLIGFSRLQRSTSRARHMA